MVNKKKRLFKILFFPISLLICLSIFMISSFAQSGYNIDSKGNLNSYNIANLNNLSNLNSVNSYDYSIFGQTLYLNNTDSSDDDPFIYFNNFITLKANTTYTAFLVSNNNIQYGGLTGYPYTTSLVYGISTIKSSFTTGSDNLSFGFCIEGLTGLSYEIKIMIYEGTDNLDYFPFGYYYLDNVYSNYTIYNIFNGVNVSLWDIYGSGPLTSDILSLNENSTYIDYHNLPNIISYLNSHSGSNLDYMLSFDLQDDKKTSASLLVELNSYDTSNNVSILVNNGRSHKIFTQNVNSNVIIVNTFNDVYSFLDIEKIQPIYSSYGSLRISLINADTSNYNYGYSNGYNDGLNDGEAIGYQSGYQSGYNTGSTTNIETNGIRTLFNSILSFPVDMIKSVFNFEFMGVNIASVITFIISIGIVAFVLKKFL